MLQKPISIFSTQSFYIFSNNSGLVIKNQKQDTTNISEKDEFSMDRSLIENVKLVWHMESECLNFTIELRNVIVVEDFVDNNETKKLYNIFLSFIAFRIYKYKMNCKFEN